jgi:hypothetical protein
VTGIVKARPRQCGTKNGPGLPRARQPETRMLCGAILRHLVCGGHGRGTLVPHPDAPLGLPLALRRRQRPQGRHLAPAGARGRLRGELRLCRRSRAVPSRFRRHCLPPGRSDPAHTTRNPPRTVAKCASSHANPQKQAPCPQIPIDRTRCTSEPNAPALSSLGAFPTPANTPRHPRDRVASENLHKSCHSSRSFNYVMFGHARAAGVITVGTRETSE